MDFCLSLSFSLSLSHSLTPFSRSRNVLVSDRAAPSHEKCISLPCADRSTAGILRITTIRGLACKKHGVFDKARERERAGIAGRVWRWLGRSRANKREMYGRKDLICSCRVRFRMRRWWFLREEGETWFRGREGVKGGGINIHKRPERSRGRGQLTCIFRY